MRFVYQRSGIKSNMFCSLLLIVCLIWSMCLTVHAGGGAGPEKEIFIPSTGMVKQTTSKAAIDLSNTDQGYAMCRYFGNSDKVIVMVEKDGSDKPHRYYINTNGKYEAVPFSQGDGLYHIDVWELSAGHKTYDLATSTDVEVILADQFLPFLYASHVVKFTATSRAVEKSRELTEGSEDDADKIAAIYRYVVKNIHYDYQLAASPPAGYTSNPDKTLESEKGICIDYSVLAAAMLRAQGIPTKVIYGYIPDGTYHCWISVYSIDSGWTHDGVRILADRWNRLDPTFAADEEWFAENLKQPEIGEYDILYNN